MTMKLLLLAGFIFPTLAFASASPMDHHLNAKRTSDGTMGCGAYGPLQSVSTVILGYCTSGSSYICEATDSTGCAAGDASKVQQLIVREPSQDLTLGGSATVAQGQFTCPDNGMVLCSVILNDASDASSFGIRVYSDSS